MSSYAKVVIVDDEGNEGNGLFARYRDAVDYAWPGREVVCFETLKDAAAVLRWREPFVMVLDHDMKAGKNPEVAALLGVDAETALSGYHLCTALRRQHLFGLAIPVAYLTARMSGEQFLEILPKEGPFLPNFWVDKNTDPRDPDDLVRNLDEYAGALVTNLNHVANGVFLASIPEVDVDDLEEQALRSGPE